VAVAQVAVAQTDALLAGSSAPQEAERDHKRLSVLGFWRRDNRLWSFACTERMTGQHLIQSVESLLPQLDPKRQR